MKKYLLIYFVIFCQVTYGQYKISGYLITDKLNKTVYLSVLRFDEQNSMSENQIITSVTTDSLGYFEIKGNLLSEQNQYYRIYSNISENSLDLIHTPKRRNYHNFIFSNKDTIFFPKINSSIWFNKAENTNNADTELRKMIAFENDLRNEFNNTQNVEVLNEIQKIFLNKYKKYCNDSIESPLVSLLAYSRIKNEIGKLDDDYNKSSEFYNKVLSKLKTNYGNSSYYSQFREEIISLTQKKLERKYIFQRNVNYFLLFILTILTFLFIKTLKLNKVLKKQYLNETVLNLTEQEQKITSLILEGKTNKEISSKLFISLSTVKTHISKIYSKLKVANRQQIINKLKTHTKD